MLKRIATLLALLLLALGALPSGAATRVCTAGLVTAGVCRVATNRLISYDLPVAAATELVDAIADAHGYETPTPCTQRLVSAGVCSPPQLGTQVPITKAQFADVVIRQLLLAEVRRYRDQQAVAPALATSRATVDPDISN